MARSRATLNETFSNRLPRFGVGLCGPIAEEIADTALSLPIWPGMGDEQVRHITEAIRSFFID